MDILNNDEIEKLNEIKELYNNIQKKEDINEIINNIEKITEEESKERKIYLNSLLYPEKYKNVKIPSEYPIPSCTYSFHTSFIATPNDSGVFRYMINPYFLYKQRLAGLYENYKYVSEDGTIIDSTLIDEGKRYYSIDYLSSGVQFNNINNEIYIESFPGGLQANSINLKQYVPDIYLKYRLVSASIIIKYMDKLEKSSGTLGGTIVMDKLDNIFGHGVIREDTHNYVGEIIDKNICKYYDIKLIRNTFYYKEVNSIDGLKLVYFPIDNSYEEFADVIDIDDIISFNTYFAGTSWGVGNIPRFNFKLNNNYKGGFFFYFFSEGGTPGTKYKVDLYCNFECLPNLNKFNYLSVNTYNMSISSKEKQSIIKILQGKSIDSIKNFYNVLDWKNILESINQKGIKLIESEPLLGKKRNYDEIENKEENSEINDKKIDEVNKNEEEISNEINEVIDNDNKESLELLLNNVVKREERLKQIYEKNKDNPIFDKERYEELIKKNNEQKDKINDILNKLNNN